jgi:uncharacterized protein (DUF433 family)
MAGWLYWIEEVCPMPAQIIDRGRGPQIAGTRLTAYDILDYVRMGWGHARIALWFRISSEEVLAAIRYIEEHKDEVMADYQRILDRNARGNPPELRARLEKTHARVQEIMRRRRAEKERS